MLLLPGRIFILALVAVLWILQGQAVWAAPVRVISGALSASNTPLWVAQEKGLFKKYGLETDLSHVPTTQAIQSLLSGATQFTTGSSEIVSSGLAGGDAVFIAGFSNRFVFFIYGKKGMAAGADLKGKTIAVTSPEGATAVAARMALRKEGIDPEKDVKFAYIRELPALLGALREGVVDAAVMSPPTSLQAQELGLSLVLDITALKIPFVHTGVATQKSYAKTNPDVVRNFLKALVEAMKVCREQPAQTQAVIAKYTKLTNPKMVEEAYRGFQPTWEPIPYVSPQAVQAILDVAKAPKARASKAEQFLDNSFLREIENSGFVSALYKN